MFLAIPLFIIVGVILAPGLLLTAAAVASLFDNFEDDDS